jgi:hypothetical protein
VSVSGNGFKYSGKSVPGARVYVLHNTLWTDDSGNCATLPCAGVTGGAQHAGSGPNPEAFYLRNNLFRFTRYAFEAPGVPRWDEDYNHFATTSRTRGLFYGGREYTTNVAAYRAASGQGAHSNVIGDFVTASVLDGQLVRATAGDLRLVDGSAFVDAGVPVPNISDRAGVDFRGAAPDLGANER